MQIHTQTQVGGNLFYHLMLASYTDFQNTSSDVWCPIHVRFKIKLYNILTTVWTALVTCGRNALSSCLNTIIAMVTKKLNNIQQQRLSCYERHNPTTQEEWKRVGVQPQPQPKDPVLTQGQLICAHGIAVAFYKALFRSEGKDLAAGCFRATCPGE